MATEPDSDPFVGTQILGDFEIREVLGAGTFATAYLASQGSIGRQVAVKIAREDEGESWGMEVIRQRFKAEAIATGRVNHPNVVTIYSVGDTDDGLPAIVMEYLPGLDLEALLERRAPLSHGVYFPIFSQLGSALDALHRAGVVHRDVTPGNVFVSRNPHTRKLETKLIDLGIAKIDGYEGSMHETALGTAGYLAREQCEGNSLPRSDMFGLGALLWWAITGEEFLGDLTDSREILEATIGMTEAPDPRTVKPSIEAATAALISDLLSPRYEDRPTASAFVERWDQLQRRHQTRRVTRPNVAAVNMEEVTNGAGTPVNILVLGDNRDWLEPMREALADHDLTVVDSVHEGLKAARRTPFDLVLANHRLKRGSGYDAVKRMRSEGKTQQLPIICMAPHGDPFGQWSRVEADAHVKYSDNDFGNLLGLVELLAKARVDRLNAETLDELFAADARTARTTIRDFIRSVPKWLYEIEHDESQSRRLQACNEMALTARRVGADRVADIAKDTGERSAHGDEAGSIHPLQGALAEAAHALRVVHTRRAGRRVRLDSMRR